MAAVFRKSSTALITGSASGIGLAFAKVCRSHGMNLALVDSNASLLSSAAQAFSSDSSGAITESYAIDVSDLSAWRDLKPKLEQKFKTLELLHLNAGIGLKSGWEDAEYFQKVSNAISHSIDRKRALAHYFSSSKPTSSAYQTPLPPSYLSSPRLQPQRPSLLPAPNKASPTLPVTQPTTPQKPPCAPLRSHSRSSSQQLIPIPRYIF